ncbi:glycoside hydrolase [Fischerella major NIES-592]|uniref:Glycoside hydrolase n=1 Tax=Fischerella major NIES-592 TaxID=210994 RepID=A0A1U7GSZ9_9CYAN|nr:cellulase family glycosylhydrolase [Fischerella major]OKH10996.1 glycoside hydrolase [Fischerella major NIES-592]
MNRRELLAWAGIGCLANLSLSFVAAGQPSNLKKSDRTSTLYTKGRYLYNSLGNKVILRGINLPLLDDWDFPKTDKLAELEKTGANTVRIQWYKDYGQSDRPAYTIADLDNFLTRCKASRIIPVLGLWDLTCNPDVNLLNTQLIPWWTSEPVLNVLKKHQKYLIVNLVNELGVYRWANNPTSALNTFKNVYKTAITKIRQHLHLPLMIDAPDCGQSIEVFTKIGKELIAHDPDHNLLFSGHAYWAGHNGIPHLKTAIDANLPIVFGEIANKQDKELNGKTQYCYYDLDGSNQNHAPENGFTYQAFLRLLKEKEIGWLAWSWWKDNCTERQMSQNGNFSNLTPYGNDIVNNSIYGLKVTAQRAKF